MRRKPLTNDQMKNLVGHHLTDTFDTFKSAIIGYYVDEGGDVQISVAKGDAIVRYSAEDLLKNMYFRIDTPDGDTPWTDTVHEDIDNFMFRLYNSIRYTVLTDMTLQCNGKFIMDMWNKNFSDGIKKKLYELADRNYDEDIFNLNRKEYV